MFEMCERCKWKEITAFLVAALGVFLVAGAAFAADAKASTGDVIGIIDSQLIVSKHPDFEKTAKELQQVLKQKESEAKAAADKESEPSKKAQIVQAKRMEAAKEEQRLMEPIFKACQEAVRVVAKQRNVTIVLEKASVYFGGQDITDYVVQQLSRK
jgi:outer membrane protein